MTETLSVLMHERTKKQLELFINSPSHALLITGLPGNGKNYLAQTAAAQLLGLKSLTDLANYPYFIHVSRPEEKQEISIDAVRELIRKLQLKTPGSRDIRRVVIIEDAQLLSDEAQNSILKVLEEPPADTVIMLTAPSDRVVLPTISSRAQRFEVLSISLKSAIDYFGGKYSDKSIQSAWNLSEGAMGLMTALLDESKSHPLKNAVGDVRTLLQQDTYERLITLDKLSKDKESLVIFLDAILRVLAVLNRTSGPTNKRVLACRKLVLNLQKRLADNANPRLIALELGLNLNI
jgi:DNA polymerase-3 subunit delta'